MILDEGKGSRRGRLSVYAARFRQLVSPQTLNICRGDKGNYFTNIQYVVVRTLWVLRELALSSDAKITIFVEDRRSRLSNV